MSNAFFFKYRIPPVRKPPENWLCLEIYPIYLEHSETRINFLWKQPDGKMSLERWRLVKNQPGLWILHIQISPKFLVKLIFWTKFTRVFLIENGKSGHHWTLHMGISLGTSSIVKWSYQDNFKPVYFIFLQINFEHKKSTIRQNKRLSPS